MGKDLPHHRVIGDPLDGGVSHGPYCSLRSRVGRIKAERLFLFALLRVIEPNVSLAESMTDHAVDDLLLGRQDRLHEALPHRPLPHAETQA